MKNDDVEEIEPILKEEQQEKASDDILKPEIQEDDENMDEILKNAAKEADIDTDILQEDKQEDKEELSLEDQVHNLTERLVRQVAENENLRKRTAREHKELGKYAVSNFAKDLISVVENLHMAASTIPQQEKENNELFRNIAVGIEMTLTEMMNTLKRYGIERFTPKPGDEFDHNKHQAVSHVESEDVEEGKIALMMQAGYTIHDRLLRPAMVNIAKKAQEKHED